MNKSGCRMLGNTTLRPGQDSVSNQVQVAKLCKMERADWPELSFAVSRCRPGTSALELGDGANHLAACVVD
jgi:hypothetical protein